MTYLRKRMIEDLQLRGMGVLTQQRYVRKETGHTYTLDRIGMTRSNMNM
ncbi:MAG: hypothetical protein ABSH41_23625 [Syntrophobacteraceae bacterium]